jgi:alpha-glucosidase (family GH31 glycosyl hydrolase)
VFDDYFMVLNSSVAIAPLGNGSVTTGVWGLGERVSSFFYPDGVFTSLSRDAGSPFDNGKLPGSSMYGHHPIYFGRAADSVFFGVFNLNGNAADFHIKNSNGSTEVTQVTIGGIFDVYVILASTPDQAVVKYHSIIGNPVMIPQWGLGWHQCRWGYNTTDVLVQVLANYSAAGIPLDVIWSDIDYLDRYRDFTHDPIKFANLSSFIDMIHANLSLHYVPIIDAGVARRPWGSYPAYDDGVASGAFIKNNATSTEDFIGQVWPNDAVFPDFLGAAGQAYWKRWLTTMHDSMAFDGLW